MPDGKGSTPAKSHQDYVAHQGSSNSITTWIPLQDTFKKIGSLNIIKGSHKKGFVRDDLNWKKGGGGFNILMIQGIFRQFDITWICFCVHVRWIVFCRVVVVVCKMCVGSDKNGDEKNSSVEEDEM